MEQQLNIWQHPAARLRTPGSASAAAALELEPHDAVAMSVCSNSTPSDPSVPAAAAAAAAAGSATAACNVPSTQQSRTSLSQLSSLIQASAAAAGSAADADAHSQPISSSDAAQLSPQRERPKKRKARYVLCSLRLTLNAHVLVCVRVRAWAVQCTG